MRYDLKEFPSHGSWGKERCLPNVREVDVFSGLEKLRWQASAFLVNTALYILSRVI